MNIKELYQAIGGDYDEVLTRLLGKDSMVIRYAKRFSEDPAYGQLENAVRENDPDAVFHAVHTLKGVAATLGFTRLFQVSSSLTELVRRNASGDLPAAYSQAAVLSAFEAVKTEYANTVDALEKLGE